MPQQDVVERSWCVYVHTNNINGKKYFGVTSKNPPSRRWGRNGSAYAGCNRFYNAINKYGWDNFSHEILYEGLDESEAKTKEIELIDKYNTTDDEFGYNITSGGDGSIGRPVSEETRRKIGDANRGHKHTEETKRKMSERLLGNKLALGLCLSEEARIKIGEKSKGNQYAKGYRHTEEMKRHLSEVHKGYTPSAETIEKLRQINTGRKASEETRMKISESKTGKPRRGVPHSDAAKELMSKSKKELLKNEPWRLEELAKINRKPVDMLTMDGEYVRTYSCALAAKQELGIDNSSIIKVCKGKMKSAGGYLWRYNVD